MATENEAQVKIDAALQDLGAKEAKKEVGLPQDMIDELTKKEKA